MRGLLLAASFLASSTLAIAAGTTATSQGPNQCDPASLIGTWVGSCSSKTGTDSTTSTFVCSSGDCTQDYEITYTSAHKSIYTSFPRFTAGTSSSCKHAANGAALDPSGQNGTLSNFSTELALASQGGNWFPGTPCVVTVEGTGCYLAWSNGTHYFEEGNYDRNLSYIPGCPNCSRAGNSTDGSCSEDGSLSCTTTHVNYRCVAKKLEDTTTSPGGCPVVKEQCCTRVLTKEDSSLLITFPEAVHIASIKLWDQGLPGPLVTSAGQLDGAYVTVYENDNVANGCEILPAAPGAASADHPGYAESDLVCGGAVGKQISMAFPKLRAGVAGRRVAVRLCTVKAAGGAPPPADQMLIYEAAAPTAGTSVGG